MSFIERLFSLRRLKCTCIIEKAPQSVSFIERLSSLWRLKCTSIREKAPQSVSFIERLSSLWRLKCTSIREKAPQSVSFIERIFEVSFIRGSTAHQPKALQTAIACVWINFQTVCSLKVIAQRLRFLQSQSPTKNGDLNFSQLALV